MIHDITCKSSTKRDPEWASKIKPYMLNTPTDCNFKDNICLLNFCWKWKIDNTADEKYGNPQIKPS